MQEITKGKPQMSHSGSLKCFPVKRCQYQHHFVSYIISFLLRREEENTDYEGGSVCPRKWMAVILPRLVQLNVILRKIMSRNGCNRNSSLRITDVSLSFIFYRLDSGSWGIFLTLTLPLLSLQPARKRFFYSSQIQTNCPFFLAWYPD